MPRQIIIIEYWETTIRDQIVKILLNPCDIL
jgi:hypothetical protein